MAAKVVELDRQYLEQNPPIEVVHGQDDEKEQRVLNTGIKRRGAFSHHKKRPLLPPAKAQSVVVGDWEVSNG